MPASIACHLAVIFGGAVAWPYVSPPPAERTPVVPIDIITIAAVTDIAPVVKPREEPEPEPEEEPPAIEDFLEDVDTLPEEAPDPETEPPPPSAEPEAAPPEPEPTPESVPEEEAELEQDEPEPPKPDQQRPVLPEEDPLDSLLSESSNLFDRARDTPRAAPPPQQERRELQDEQEPRRAVGEGRRQQARIESIIVSQMKVCWDSVDDLPDNQRLVVTLGVKLRPDGTLDSVDLVNPSRPPIGDRYMGVAIDRALTATRKCSPYRLPEDDYEVWREMTFVVGPQSSS
ncbi:MAG: cell envelope integrity protein TolA [Pseudomonadota bacterium]